MSRGAWGGVMVASLLASSGAGYYVYEKDGINRLMQTAAVAPEPLKAPEQVTPPIPAVEPSVAEAAPETQPPATTRNILFRLPKPTAKNVSIIGDFNEWKRTSLNKNQKTWEISIALEPGSYKYMYVVDDKRIKDPNNKNVQDGKSVINVKPLQ